MNKHDVKGKANKAAGSVKEGIGDATDNKDLEAEGKAQKTKGKVQDKVGDVKTAAKNVTS